LQASFTTDPLGRRIYSLVGVPLGVFIGLAAPTRGYAYTWGSLRGQL
jgi:hypothetical protein